MELWNIKSLIAKNDKQTFLIRGGSVPSCLCTYKNTRRCKVSGIAMYVHLQKSTMQVPQREKSNRLNGASGHQVARHLWVWMATGLPLSSERGSSVQTYNTNISAESVTGEACALWNMTTTTSLAWILRHQQKVKICRLADIGWACEEAGSRTRRLQYLNVSPLWSIPPLSLVTCGQRTL